MSATSTSTDPVQTIVDLLDGTSAGNWPNGTKPSFIEKQWATPFNKKSNRNAPAAYVWSDERGSQEQFGRDADTKIRSELIAVDVWALTESSADTLAADVLSILEDYWNDGQSQTQWNRIRPFEADDRRAETLARMSDHFVISVRSRLEREASMGT